jgi:hypothetical protein
MLFARLTWPLALGWATKTYLTEMHRSSQKSQKSLPEKSRTQIGYDAILQGEAMHDVLK